MHYGWFEITHEQRQPTDHAVSEKEQREPRVSEMATEQSDSRPPTLHPADETMIPKIYVQWSPRFFGCSHCQYLLPSVTLTDIPAALETDFRDQCMLLQGFILIVQTIHGKE